MKTKAYRAVGNALNKNPHPMTLLEQGSIQKCDMVPCHRVVGSDGKLVGFAHGLKMKADMLRKEGIRIKEGKIKRLEEVLHKF